LLGSGVEGGIAVGYVSSAVGGGSSGSWSSLAKWFQKAVTEGQSKVLSAVTMKNTVLWDVSRCSLVYVYKRLGETRCRHLQGSLNMETASSSKMSSNIWQTSRHHIQEDSIHE
jgi:hypothetical protein